MAGPIRRFLHLERARPPSSARAAPDARGRFDALEVGPELPQETHLPASAADRFRQGEEGLALDRAPEGEQPFVRCVACEADHARHTVRCSRCGAALDTPEQRAFNERLWEARRREADAEGRAADARREALEREREEDIQRRRALAEAMAEEILRRERDRLGEPWVKKAARWVQRVFRPRGT